MRDINRIEPFLEDFKTLWKQNPDLRFGQLVEILHRHSNHIELFSIEDDRMQQVIKNRILSKKN